MGSAIQKPDLTVFQQIGDQHDDVCFVFDLEAEKFVYLNAAFEPVWQKKVAEAMADPSFLSGTIHPEDRSYVEENYRKFVSEPVKMGFDFRIEWPYTTDRWVWLTVFPLGKAGEAQWVAGMVRDDSPRKKNIFNMQKINARKDSMLEILAHDLRGPIGIVQNIAASIEEKLPKTDNGAASLQLQMIQQICKRNIDLIRDLVHQEFLESAEVEISKERLDLVWEINEVVVNYRNAQENLSKVFELTSSQERVFSQIDSMKFMQVINNLLSNAIKFTSDKGVIRIHIEKKKSTIVISVSDNGVGIPKKDQPFLFDKFTKARRPGLKGEESVGLGMSIIKTIVELHNGKIYFESEVNKGSTFYIQLSAEE
jgi:two-component system sensor histidine kinase VicK